MSSQPTESTVDIDTEIATRIATAFGWDQQPATLADFAERTRSAFDASLGAEEMCTTDDSPHEAYVGDEIYRYQCVLDAFILGMIADEPVTVHTVGQVSGAEVTSEFEDGELVDLSAPSEAVMSVGVRRTTSTPEGKITPQKMYGQLCGYSHVFASRAEYEEWADATPEAITQAMPLSEGLRAVRRMVAAGPFEDSGTVSIDS